jgi:hypothetical protein
VKKVVEQPFLFRFFLFLKLRFAGREEGWRRRSCSAGQARAAHRRSAVRLRGGGARRAVVQRGRSAVCAPGRRVGLVGGAARLGRNRMGARHLLEKELSRSFCPSILKRRKKKKVKNEVFFVLNHRGDDEKVSCSPSDWNVDRAEDRSLRICCEKLSHRKHFLVFLILFFCVTL